MAARPRPSPRGSESPWGEGAARPLHPSVVGLCHPCRRQARRRLAGYRPRLCRPGREHLRCRNMGAAAAGARRRAGRAAPGAVGVAAAAAGGGAAAETPVVARIVEVVRARQRTVLAAAAAAAAPPLRHPAESGRGQTEARRPSAAAAADRAMKTRRAAAAVYLPAAAARRCQLRGRIVRQRHARASVAPPQSHRSSAVARWAQHLHFHRCQGSRPETTAPAAVEGAGKADRRRAA